MPTHKQTAKRPKKIVSLAERVQCLADAWEREANSLGAYLTPEHQIDNNHPSGCNRAYYRFAGMVNAIEYWPKRITEEASLAGTDEQLLALLNDWRTEMEAKRLELGIYLEDNAEQMEVRTQWTMEGRQLKLQHLIDALDDLVAAHKEQRA